VHRRTEAATAANDGLLLTVALNYSGRADLAAAAQRIAALAAAGQLLPEQVTADLLQQHLSTAGLLAAVGPPDLLIRSSGERRLSNFMLFEAAYCELHFPDVMWPDFGERHLLAALQDYAARERRFGRH
jgi:undecaprenyl diphosphate synthase